MPGPSQRIEDARDAASAWATTTLGDRAFVEHNDALRAFVGALVEAEQQITHDEAYDEGHHDGEGDLRDDEDVVAAQLTGQSLSLLGDGTAMDLADAVHDVARVGKPVTTCGLRIERA